MAMSSKLKRRLWPDKERFQAALHFTLFSTIIGTLGLSTYIGTMSLVNRDMQGRLDSQATNVQRAFVDRIQSYSDTLLNLRAFVARMGVRDQEEFRTLISEMKVFDYYTGISGLGITLIYPKEKKAEYEKIFGFKFHGVDKNVESDPTIKLGSALLMVEPARPRVEKIIGFNAFTDPVRREAFSQSLALNATVATPPLYLLDDRFSSSSKDERLGFLMIVPFQTTAQLLKIPAGKSPVSGLITASFRYQVLIDEIFGQPSLENERVNFVLSSIRSGERQVLYNRFSPKDPDSNLFSLQRFSVYGQTYELKITPLPSFFKNSDRYLPILSCLGVLLVGCLMLLLYRSTLNQLNDEKVARVRSRQTHEKLRRQTTLLSKLNRFGMTISKQFDPEVVLQKFFEFGEKEEFEFVSILREEEDSKDLVLLTPSGQSQTNISLSQVNELFGAVNRIGRGDLDHSPAFLKELGLAALSDWQIIRVRFNQRSSFLIIGLRSDAIDEADIELMKSTFSQLVVALETAVLLQRAEEGSRLKTAFLANMSHEIRTPLNAILGFTQILTRSNISLEKRQQLVGNIEKNTGLLTRLIDDILDISKVEAGKIDIVLSKTSFEDLLQDTRDVFELKAQEKEIQFNLEIKTQLPKFIKTDEFRFKQILFNLVSNAVKFTDHGKVTVRVYSELKSELAKITFEIEDSGVGIPKNLQSQLFTAFYQGDLSTTRRFGGSGLGLTLSRRLAGEMNGDIELLSSEPGKGSIFSFHIDCLALAEFGSFRELSRKNRPPLPTKSLPKKPAESSPTPLEGRKVLLVEDSEDNQIIFTHFLEQAGASAVVASDGKEALAQARQLQDLDLVLMDIQIPLIDGREVTRILRQEGYKKPIIALTAHALESEKRSCKEAGCDDQITKPTTYAHFIGTIIRQLQPKSAESDSRA
jgi:signal transduction histidine kinase/CHASE1-domain containing sensor protein/ActR/RegA family two-component response regulator